MYPGWFSTNSSHYQQYQLVAQLRMTALLTSTGKIGQPTTPSPATTRPVDRPQPPLQAAPPAAPQKPPEGSPPTPGDSKPAVSAPQAARDPKPEEVGAATKPDAKKRVAIAAEALTNASDVKIPSIPKSDAVLQMFGEPLS